MTDEMKSKERESRGWFWDLTYYIGPDLLFLFLFTASLAVLMAVYKGTFTFMQSSFILPLIFLAVGQSSGLLLVPLPVALAIGGVIWVAALVLVQGGAKRFTRDQLAARV